MITLNFPGCRFRCSTGGYLYRCTDDDRNAENRFYPGRTWWNRAKSLVGGFVSNTAIGRVCRVSLIYTSFFFSSLFPLSKHADPIKTRVSVRPAYNGFSRLSVDHTWNTRGTTVKKISPAKRPIKFGESSAPGVTSKRDENSKIDNYYREIILERVRFWDSDGGREGE